MTSDILKRAAEAVEGTTPGPWRNEIRYSFIAHDNTWHVLWDVPNSTGVSLVSDTGGSTASCKNDARFIAASRTLIPDMAAAIAERDAEVERLTARAEAAEAQVANAGAVMVEACAKAAIDNQDCSPWEIADEIRALSTLSPIAAAARVLLADDVAISRMAEAIHDGPLGAEGHWFSAATEQGGWCVDVVRAGLRSLAEQEKADE